MARAEADVVFTEEDGWNRNIKGRIVGAQKVGDRITLDVDDNVININGNLCVSLPKQGAETAVLSTMVRTESRTYEARDTEEIRDVLKALGITVSGVSDVQDASDSPPEHELLKKSLAFAEMDYNLVHKEISDIKAYRTTISMGTLGTIGAAGIAILGIVGASNSTSWEGWLLWASAISITILTGAILATIHMARGLNERMGYMETLAEHLAKAEPPPRFSGWTKGHKVGDHCKIYGRKVTGAKRRPAECPLDDDQPHCAEEAKKRTSEMSKEIELFPNLLSSFASLSTYIYAVAYILYLYALLWSIMATTKTHMPDDFSRVTYGLCVLAGGIFTGAFAFVIFLSRRPSTRKPVVVKTDNAAQPPGINVRPKKKTIWAKVAKGFKIYTMVAAFSLPLVLLGLVYAYIAGAPRSAMAMTAYGLGAIISVVAVCILFWLGEQVNSLRRGRYSVEHWRHIWSIRFTRCPLMATAEKGK